MNPYENINVLRSVSGMYGINGKSVNESKGGMGTCSENSTAMLSSQVALTVQVRVIIEMFYQNYYYVNDVIQDNKDQSLVATGTPSCAGRACTMKICGPSCNQMWPLAFLKRVPRT